MHPYGVWCVAGGLRDCSGVKGVASSSGLGGLGAVITSALVA